MAKNVMKMLKPSPNRGKNAFDLSHRHILGASFGELLPITCLETVPGDYFEINCADLLRAFPMVTSPFMRAKQHLDFWFVPYTDLWHNFNQFITSKDQPQSPVLQNYLAVPHFSIDTFHTVYGNAISNSVTDVHGIAWSKGAQKLYNLLGYGDISIIGSASSGNPYPDCNLWRIAAYNYIWYNEYRQQYYDDGMRLVLQNPSLLFNFDDLQCDTYANANITTATFGYSDRLTAMFQMRYRCWKKDLYTGLMPSTQFGNLSAVSLSSVQIKNDVNLSSYTAANISAGVNSVSSSGGLNLRNNGNNISGSTFWTVPDAFDVLALRNAQAVQIWRENALRSGNRVNDNMRGHYGVVPSYQRDHRPVYIGSYDSVLNISDINATAQTGTSGNEQLGDVAGKGLSSLDSKKLKFQCNDFGVIMGIFSLLPEAEYDAFGIERPNQLLDQFDYFSPEMENLGLEAVSSNNFLALKQNSANVLGYAPRYYAYKTKLDKVFGLFQNNRSLASWCSPKFDVYQALNTSTGSLPLSTLYVNPKIFDVNFVADAATIGEQFMCDFFFDVEAVRHMTVLGLPTA